MMINFQLKSFEFGLLKMAKVLPYQLVAGLLTLASTYLPNWHPTTASGIAEFAILNLVVVQLHKWQMAHQALVQAKQTPEPTAPPVTPPVAPAETPAV